MSELRIFNRQKTRRINTPLLRKITLHLLAQWPGLVSHEFAIHLVDPSEMTQVNEQFLGHEGSTDVITFDNSEGHLPNAMAGELFICIQDALDQAQQFHTTWQSELARYVAHGLLHLRGYDDLKPDLRRVMKREENRQVTELERLFDLDQLERNGITVKTAKKPSARGNKTS
jgi:rRNA maturation RNase YbeY